MLTANPSRPAKVAGTWVLKDLPPYRPVARKLMMLAAQANVRIDEVQQVLRTDAAFSADVLRLANSPLIGVRGGISSVMQAVMMLGLERIKALATTLALRTFLSNASPTSIVYACWRHNLATAIVCERLARILHLDSDTAYTGGLLHDVGRLALLHARPDEYSEILESAASDGPELLAQEKALFEVDHCLAGKWILEQWQFPAPLRQVAYLHHQTPQPHTEDLLRVVHVGWRLADLLGFSILRHLAPGEIEEILSVLPGRAPQQVIAAYDGLAEDVAYKINAIECTLV